MSSANSPAGITATGGDNRSAAQWPPQSPGAKPYPEMPQVSDKKPLLESIGASGVAIFSGIITSEEYNPDFYWRDGIKVYEQMLRSDGQIRAIRQVVENPIKRATWSIEPGSTSPRDKEVAAFVESCLFHDMVYTTDEGRTRRQAWATILHHILMHLWYGFMAFEVDWRVEDGWVKWAKWEPLLPRTVWRWWVGRDTELVGIQQWTFKDWNYAFTDIPSDKLLLFIHQQEGANYEGLSLLRTAYKHWWYKQNFEKIEAIGIERNAVVPPIITLPQNFTAADIAAAQKLGANMRASELGYATLPPGWMLDYPAHMTPFTSQVQPAIQYHDVLIARNVLAQFINLGSTETGAYALADAQQEMFLQALEAVTDYICDIINNDAIPRLVDYNFDNVAVYPRLRAARLANADISQVADAIGKLKARDANFLSPDPEMEDYLREQFGFPKAPKSVVQALNPTAESTPQRPDNAGQAADHTDQQSQSQATKPQQTQAANQAQVSAATNAITPAAPGDGGALAEGAAAAAEDVRLLREAVASIAGLDAVERGMRFFNPNHLPAGPGGGQFASGGSGGGAGSGSPKGGSAPASHHWEGKSTYGNWSSAHKGLTATVDAQGGKATLTKTAGNGKTETHLIEADHEYGGYKATNTANGEVEHGLSVKGVNDYIKSEIGGPVSAKGTTMLKGGKILDASMLEAPGAKPNAAQKAINKANEAKALAAKAWNYQTNGGTKSAALYTNGGKSVEYHNPDGSMTRVTRNPDDKSYTVEHFAAKANTTVTAAESWWDSKAGGGAGEKSFEDKASSTKVYKTEKGVNTTLGKNGVVGQPFNDSHLALHNPPATPTFTPITSSSVSPHSTTGWKAAMAQNTSGGKVVAEAGPGDHVGEYHVQVGHTDIGIRASATGSHELELTYSKPGGKKEVVSGLTPDEAKADLASRGFKSDEAHQFVDMAHEDANTFFGKATAEQQARIDAVTARRAALDAQLGQYSAKAATAQVNAIYKAYPEVRAALTAHLSGGAHLQESSVATQIHGKGLTHAEKVARAKEGLQKLHDVSEWSLLHQTNVTREGTIRLFHGTNGKSSPSIWKARLEDTGQRRGTPMTDRWSVARAFSDSGKHGRLIVSAHVPVEAISIWHGVRGDTMYAHEREYTLGTGAIANHSIINLNTLK